MYHGRFAVCGCHYVYESRRRYLPLADFKSHTTVYSRASSTTLTQTFSNTSESPIKNLRYTFPLYDGVSVVDFKCEIGDKVVKGVVKEKDEAKATFNEAVKRGETAGLLEQSENSADVFSTTLGNVPAQSKVIVTITYVGELKHDAEVDGTRFTIPTKIAPRYGSSDVVKPNSAFQNPGRISITVDVALNAESPIKKLQSPSHPVSVSIGTLSNDPDEVPSFSKGHATLTLGSTELDHDFVLQICGKDAGKPFVLLEKHSSVAGYRALMTSLVPKFQQKVTKPELIFVVDRSGSMQGRMETVITALTLLIKSCPAGVKFNICSFGHTNSFLWDKSQAYSESNVDKALKHVQSMSANYGGTETLGALKEVMKKRFKDLPTEVILLTDGQIMDQNECFTFIRGEVAKSKGLIRLFPLGIGHGISSSMVEGVARAGNGFAQMVTDEEIMDSKVLKMLKGALSPHLKNLTMEVKFADDSVEKITDSLRLNLDITDSVSSGTAEKAKKPMSFYDTTAEDTPMSGVEEPATGKYSHLPEVKPPKLLQAPAEIPPLFPSSRFTAYLLISPDGPSADPVSVTLKGESDEAAFELPVAVEQLALPGQMIHQLAVRKTCQELEEGGGWLTFARSKDGALLKESHAGRFDQFVEREAVRLGVQFQVGGKFTSFVAVEANADAEVHNDDNWTEIGSQSEMTFDDVSSDEDAFTLTSSVARARKAPSPRIPGAGLGSAVKGAAVSAYRSAVSSASRASSKKKRLSNPVGRFRSPPPSTTVLMEEKVEQHSAGGWDQVAPSPALAAPETSMAPEVLAQYEFEMDEAAHMPLADEDDDLDVTPAYAGSLQAFSLGTLSSVHDAQVNQASVPTAVNCFSSKRTAVLREQQSYFLGDSIQRMERKEAQKDEFMMRTARTPSPSPAKPQQPQPPTTTALFSALVHAQSFDGSWDADRMPPYCARDGIEGILGAAMGFSIKHISDKDAKGKKASMLATAVAITYLQVRMPERAESVELILDKARAFLESIFQGDEALEKEVFAKATELVEGAPVLS